jgi:hypothetical protein
MRRNKKIASLLMAAALCMGGCGLTETINNEVPYTYTPSEAVLVFDKQSSGSVKTPELPEGFEAVLENDYLTLYMGKQYDIALLEKATGNITYSNVAYYDMTAEEQKAVSSEIQKTLFSQVSVEYYNDIQKRLTMSSFPDAYSADKDQVTWSVENDVLTVTYGIGTNITDSIIVDVFTNETYQAYADKFQEMINNKEITILDARAFYNNYTELNLSKMTEADQETYKERYPEIETYGTIYEVKANMSTKAVDELLAAYSLVGIVDDTVKEAELAKLGEAATKSIPAYFSIPLCYRLQGNDLLVSVDLKDIQGTEGYRLTRVEFLKCFGATRAEQDGYVFMPDGSGSIIENDIDANSMDNILIPFYGEELTKMMYSGTMGVSRSPFPVFGVKGGDQSLFAVVENGAAIGGMGAQAHSSYMPYNIAYPWVTVNIIDTFGFEGVAYAYYNVLPDVDYTVRYHFLSGEDADYSGMARYYRQYLEQKGALTRRESSKQDTLLLDIELLGSIKKTVNYVGFPIDTHYPVTTFEQAGEIVELLHQGGIPSVDVVYSGIANGGMEQKALNKVKFQKELGGIKGFQELESSLASQNDTVYAGLEPMRIWEKGYGIGDTEDVCKLITKVSAQIGNSNRDSSYSWWINPLRYEEITKKFLKEYEKTGSRKIYLSSVGAYLNGNYSEKQGMTRQSAQLLTQDMISEIAGKGYQIKLDMGNDYLLQYADSLINVPTSSSHQRVESYSVPFVGMVLKGYIPFSGYSINQSANSATALLEAIESGAGLNYLLVYDSQLNLQDTNFESLFSANYQIHLQDIIDNWTRLNAQMGDLQNVRIQRHQQVAEDVKCVTYEDGTKIYVNYSKNAYQTEDGTVEALSWLVVRR